MKQFNVKKLFVTQACLHALHYTYLCMPWTLCCSQLENGKIIEFGDVLTCVSLNAG